MSDAADGQRTQALAAKVIVAPYHLARYSGNPNDGATQATILVDNAGKWVADGQTLPGMLQTM